MQKYVVELTTEERSELKNIIDADRMAAHKRWRWASLNRAASRRCITRLKKRP